MEQAKQSSSGLEFKLHPLVLINVSDHHTRTRVSSPPGTHVTVLGCLLGQQSGREVDVSNSFEVKHTASNGTIVIDKAFLLTKLEQYKQVFPKLDIVGWYCTGEALEDGHRALHHVIAEVNESPVFLLLNPRIDHTRKDLPITLYETELHVIDGSPTLIFVEAHYTIETSDAERIGVDLVAKILPSGKATGSEQLTAHLVGTLSATKMMTERLRLLQQLLRAVEAGEIPYPHALMRKVASLVHSLPTMDTPQFKQEYLTEHNDALLSIYLASMTKGVNQLNDLVDKVSVAYEKSSRRRGL